MVLCSWLIDESTFVSSSTILNVYFRLINTGKLQPSSICNFTITAAILVSSLANFHCRQFVIVKTILTSVFFFIITLSKWCADPLSYHFMDPQLLHDNVMMKFMINNRTDPWKTELRYWILGYFWNAYNLGGKHFVLKWDRDFKETFRILLPYFQGKIREITPPRH